MRTTATATIAPAPKFAGMRDWDCARCGRAEVKPVFLTVDGATDSYGSGCAAVMLGRPLSAARKVVDEAAAIERREAARLEMIEERKARYARALEAFSVDANRENVDLTSARKTYHNGGGFKAYGLFPAWLAYVADTGDVETREAA